MKNTKTSLVALVALLYIGCGGADTPVQEPTPMVEASPVDPPVESPEPKVSTSNIEAGSVAVPSGQASNTVKWTGVRSLQVSAAITAWTNEPIAATKSFSSGTRRIYATFEVRTDDPNPYVTAVWLRDGKELAANDLECAPEVRCVDAYQKGKQLPAGQYEVEIEVNGEMMASRGFHVGGESISPMLRHVALGVAKGRKRMPKRHNELYKGATSGMRCGVKISNLPQEATVKVKWVAVIDDGDVEKHKSEEIVTGGGTKTAVLEWSAEGDIPAGRYKAVVYLGSRKLEELAFKVE